MTLSSFLSEFKTIVDGIYGTYLDACDGFSKVHSAAVGMEEEARRLHQESQYANLQLGGLEFSYGRHLPVGSPGWAGHLHQIPIDVLRNRNAKGGTNFQFVGNMCVVTLYQYWDERYRPAIAQATNTELGDLKVPIFGDLRHLRNAIIHNKGIATSSVEAAEVFQWFKRGETILFTRPMFEEIVDRILLFLREFRGSHEESANNA